MRVKIMDMEEYLFQDYVNELLLISGLSFANIRIALRQEPLPSIESRMTRLLKAKAPDFLLKFSQKADRLERVIVVINSCEDEVIFRQAINELWRLLYGEKEERPYPGEEYHPDLLGLE